ncbi:MAG: guanylate kinase [Chloroflexi bacterium]|nr:guanylate kinase [Chloroflexota bacterium]
MIGASVSHNNLYQREIHPLLIVISGPSGVGKDTIALGLIEKRPEKFYFVVTATTRPPREGEIHGKDYFFLSTDEFAHMIESNEFLEHAIVYNDYKGIPKEHIRNALASGKDVIMRVDVQGAATVRKLIPNATFIFLTTRSEDILVKRLRERKSETSEGLNLRTATARLEMKRIDEFDYCVLNEEGKQEETMHTILSIIDAEHSRVGRTPIIL